MNGGVVWLVVALGLGVPTLRRRTIAVALVTVQALLLAATAAVDADVRAISRPREPCSYAPCCSACC